MKFKAEKWHAMQLRKSSERLDCYHKLGTNSQQLSEREKDLKVIIDRTHSAENNSYEKIREYA